MPNLIDGNNLLGAIAGKKVEDASSREELMNLMFRYCRAAGNKIDLVFDGPPHGGLRNKMHYGRVQVIFSGSERDADSIIIKRIRTSKTPHEFIVVSSDSAVYQKARSLGAKALQSRQFYQQVQLQLTNSDTIENDVAVSENEVDEWMDYFGIEEDAEVADE